MNDTNTSESAASTTTKLDLVFLGADGFPIEGLKGRVVVDTEERPFETNALGTTHTLSVVPEATVQVHVMRLDGTYKEIQRCEAGHADACWSFISPSIVFEATTELHQGEPGTIAQDIPHWAAGDEGERDKGQEAIAGAAPFEEGFEPPQVVLGDVPHAKPLPTPASPAKAAAPHVKAAPMPDPSRAQATQTIKSTVTTGRDANGNPMVVFTKKVRDWWGSWHFPTWDLSWGAQAATVPPSRSTVTAAGAGAAITSAQLQGFLNMRHPSASVEDLSQISGVNLTKNPRLRPPVVNGVNAYVDVFPDYGRTIYFLTKTTDGWRIINSTYYNVWPRNDGTCWGPIYLVKPTPEQQALESKECIQYRQSLLPKK